MVLEKRWPTGESHAKVMWDEFALRLKRGRAGNNLVWSPRDLPCGGPVRKCPGLLYGTSRQVVDLKHFESRAPVFVAPVEMVVNDRTVREDQP
jgi:hypothetical protein